ncbi:hypothetical protein X975_16184, partial [Stegodyphus mimosarum]
MWQIVRFSIYHNAIYAATLDVPQNVPEAPLVRFAEHVLHISWNW